MMNTTEGDGTSSEVNATNTAGPENREGGKREETLAEKNGVKEG